MPSGKNPEAARAMARAAAVERSLCKVYTLECGHYARKSGLIMWKARPGFMRCEHCDGFPERAITPDSYPGVWPGPDDVPPF